MIRRALILLTFVTAALNGMAEGVPQLIRFGEVGGTNVRMIGGKPAGVGLVALALHLGFFEEAFGPGGPKIDQIYFAGTGPAMNEALTQGNIEFATYGGVPNVIGLIGHIPAHIVLARRSTGASGGNSFIAVRNDSPIKTLNDLKGKRITVQKGTLPYQMLVLFLESRGIGENELQLVNLAGTEALVAFEAGAVDAVYGGLNLLLLRDDGKLRILESTRGFSLPAIASGTLVSDRFAKEHPEAVLRVLKAMIKAAWWASEEKNREELLRFISERSFSYRYVAEDYEGSLKERYNPLIDDSIATAFGGIVRFSYAHKLIRKEADEVTIRGWFVPEYQRAALKDLGLENYWSSTSESVASNPR